MKYVLLPDCRQHTLAFYLAMEEWVARHGELGDCFFMWQVEPSVIFGRHQDIMAEVNLDYCRTHLISIYRRKSGGGCVYADMGNVMLSFMTSDDNVSATFERYLSAVRQVLGQMGIEATSTAHNDIMIDGRKVSGNAFYQLPGRSVVHGTLLYDTQMEHMVRSITPPEEKLVRHGVQSVRQRICLLKDYTTLSLDEVKAFIRTHLTDGAFTLPPHAIAEIEAEERKLLDPAWIYGHQPKH